MSRESFIGIIKMVPEEAAFCKTKAGTMTRALVVLVLLTNAAFSADAFVVRRSFVSQSSCCEATTRRTRIQQQQPNNHHQPLFFSPRPQQDIVSASTASGGAAATAILDPWESWCLSRLKTSYQKALRIKCPFLRRRASDALDGLEMILRFLIVRHKSLDLLGPPVGWRCEGQEGAEKEMFLPTYEVMDRIRADWKPNNHKGYYITGRLSTELYRDDCFFDGPDPDMPVRGLRKYLNAASQLFETKSSVAELLQLEHDVETDLITATWKIKGVLHLPWRPTVPEWTGTTTYHRDENGLIYKHVETWDLSVTQAFLKTLLPELANRIWKEEGEREGHPTIQPWL